MRVTANRVAEPSSTRSVEYSSPSGAAAISRAARLIASPITV